MIGYSYVRRSLLLVALAALSSFHSAAPFVAQAQVETQAVQGAENTQSSLGIPDAETVPYVAPESPMLPGAREASLSGVLAARRQIEAEILERQNALRSDAARGREAEIEGEIHGLSDDLAALNRNFSELAAGVSPRSVDLNAAPSQLNLTSEVRDLIGPLVNELKRATSRPREIDKLRTEISESGARLDQVTTALASLDRLKESLRDPDLIDAIRVEKKDWNRRKNAISASLKVAQQKLDQRMGDSQSISQAIENLFQLFFKSRGRNLLLVLVAMLGFLLAIRKLRAFISRRASLSNRVASFQGRVLSLVSSAFTVIGAILVFLISLYFFGDWVLLILVLLLILGLIWTSKQAIPRFWSQAVLILDMGVVRERERVVYNGIPWLVQSICFYSVLVNPALVGGTLRLPIDDLSELRSRAHDENEPWFPTQTGDVILLPDGRPAKVMFQSIEGVHLASPGGNRTIIPAAEFCGQSVEELSGGYRASITFGLDYGDQAQITTSIRETIQQGVDAMWRESRWSPGLIGTSVEFKEAGASSLDFFVRVDLDGSSALDLQAQQRALSRFCVDICNENGWVIPFTQLTLHVAPSPEAQPA